LLPLLLSSPSPLPLLLTSLSLRLIIFEHRKYIPEIERSQWVTLL
jgi:hypothetical protein